MKPIVYVYEEQLQLLLLKFGPVCGIAFEYKNENVFHVHTEFPEVAPSGIPNAAVLAHLSPDDFQSFTNEKAKSLFKSVTSKPVTNWSNTTIVIVFALIDDQLYKKAFAFNNKTQAVAHCEVQYVPSKGDLYSRSKGILETDILATKRVAIIGLGSFGSHIAVELVKAGIGSFRLFDFDRIEHHNLARHTCGIYDLGRLKTNAVKDQLLLKNPHVQVTTHEYSILDQPESFRNAISECDLVICATDNNPSRAIINDFAHQMNKVALFGKAYTRALGGDIFRLRPGGPCYSCVVDTVNRIDEEISQFEQARENMPAYVSDTDVKATIQVGLSSDIAPVCNMMVKLALIELSRGLPSGIQVLEEELTYDYYIWINRREEIYKTFAPFNNARHQPTILKWYGVQVEHDPNCMTCQN